MRVQMRARFLVLAISHYFDYTFGLAVHTASGDVTVPGSTIAPIVVSNDDVNDSSDLVHNAASAGNIDHQWQCALILRNRRAHLHTVLENPGLFLSVPCTARGKT